MDELTRLMGRCDMGVETRDILPLPDEIRSMIMEQVKHRIRTLNDVICYNEAFMRPLNYYIYEQTYCSISGPVITDKLDEVTIVLSRTVEEANLFMGRYVKFYEYDCPVCVPRWLPLYVGDEADIMLEQRERLKNKGIVVHLGGHTSVRLDRLRPL
jgi:hypothetical protein